MQILGSILRLLFAWIDGIVAKVITLVYGLLSDLASLTLYSENIVKVIGQRIGILLGIFMLFRIAVSLINYMISPDKFSDGKQGGAALVKNVIISLALLATVNTIFETAYSVQEKIIKSQIIEKIFFGETSQTKMDIGYYLYTGFFTPNPDVLENCDEMWNPTFDLANSQCNSDLGEIVETNALNSIHDARNNLDMSQIFSNYDVVMANKGGAFKGKLVFNYLPIISTAAGVVTLLIMISFSMELAKRAIKLLFLQIVAPVPIIFNMDTGKGKDVFQKWYKECFNTYISVFIRILAINFAVFIIVLLKSEFSSVFKDKIGINIFIIIGCLLFAKEVPKLIEDMLGIKLDGMTFRPLKKFQEQALFGKQITGIATGTAARTLGATGGFIAGARAGGRVGDTLGGAAVGALMGARARAKDGKLSLSTSTNDVYKRMTGNNFIDFSLEKLLFQRNKEEKIQEIKDARNVATDLLNSYNSQLNVSEGMTSNFANEMVKRGINIKDLNNERQNAMSYKEKLKNLKDDEEKVKRNLNDINNEIRGYLEREKTLNKNLEDARHSGSMSAMRYNTDELEKLKVKLDAAQKQKDKYEADMKIINNYDNEMKKIDESLDLMNNYEKGMSEQDKLRKKISAVQKDIDDLNTEKRQRERFYDYDPSPQGDIRELINATHSKVQDGKTMTGAENYKSRIDKKS